MVQERGIQQTKNNVDSPFEWLTNFRSLRHLILPSRIMGIGQTFNAQHQPLTQLNALHVGCGTSTVGESLICLRECTNDGNVLQYSHVINVDNDKKALNCMKRRWENRIKRERADGIMDWKCLDFSSNESCRSALDGVYHQLMQNHNTANNELGGCFDLVLDKSTLDCLLCAETSVVAQFLCEVYRALRVPTTDFSECNSSGRDISSWGGIYVLVTFHPAEFIEKLLKQLPGTDWHVDWEVINREIEDVNQNRMGSNVDTVVHSNICQTDSSNTVDLHPAPSSSAWSSGTFEPDENYRKTVTVFTCRRQSSRSSIDESSCSPLPSYILDKGQVQKHIERTCDDWYQTINPMVTGERENELRLAFLEAATANIDIKCENDDRRDGKSANILKLKKCYEILFTDAEKEHLSYEYFLEDWDAYCNQREDNDSDPIRREGMTISIALDFLKEMQ